ncbi:MAG: hypothetical protein K0S46_280 [Moraxellaceae bacterium]|nr:hypothetical protein [Moraxellaceae bacterium]
MSAVLAVDEGTLKVSGALDFSNADACCDEGLALLAKMPADAVVDLSGLQGASTISVAVLLRWARSMVARNGRLRITKVPERCRAILRVSGLAEALPEIS